MTEVDNGRVDGIVVHYGEIALKGKNRDYFENKLVSNIKETLSELEYEKIKRLPGRIFVKFDSQSHPAIVDFKERLMRVFGVVNFSFVQACPQKIETMEKVAWRMANREEFASFKIETKRSDKNFPLNSVKTNERLGAYLQKRFEKEYVPKEVDLVNPDLTIFVEIVANKVFLYKEKIPAPGGLPVTTSGKLVGLLSSGIDSPVAAWQMMKRGSKVVFCHFHSYPRTDRVSQRSAKDLAGVLSAWQLGAKLYLVNIKEIQKEIIMQVPKRLRIIFYRRAMLKLAARIADKEEALGLVTGDSLGQVSSQTLENLRVVSEAISASLPIYRPNVGLNKEEITSLSKKINTFDISSKKVRDCCVYMRPNRPETKASLSKIQKIAKNLEIDELIEKSSVEIEVERFRHEA